MTDRDRLAETVAADPLNVVLRLVFADAQEEVGDTGEAERQRKLAQEIEASRPGPWRVASKRVLRFAFNLAVAWVEAGVPGLHG